MLRYKGKCGKPKAFRINKVKGERPVRSDLQRRANVMSWVSAWRGVTARCEKLKYQSGALQTRHRATDRIAAFAGYRHIRHICGCDGSHAI